jgi:hypothetical protein
VITSVPELPQPPTGSQVIISGAQGVGPGGVGVSFPANNGGNNPPTWTITSTGTITFSLNSTSCPADVTFTGDGIWTLAGHFADDNQPPVPYTVDIAKGYAAILPGHPDSGKPITREFPTRAALLGYMQERRQAALRHYASAGG